MAYDSLATYKPAADALPTNLPIQFSYTPPAPRRRMVINATGDGGRTVQSFLPESGDTIIKWKIESATQDEWHQLMQWFLDPQAMVAAQKFTGYWGDAYDVLFSKFNDATVRAKNFDLSGEFIIVNTTAPIWSSPEV